VFPLRAAPLHSKAHGPEQPEQADDKHIKRTKDDPINISVNLPCRPIDAEPRYQDRKVQRRIVVMHISNTAHSHKRQIVQEPSNHRVDTGIVELIDVGLLEVVIAALPADEVPSDHEGEDAEGGGAAPVNGWVAEEEVLYDCTIVSIHKSQVVDVKSLLLSSQPHIRRPTWRRGHCQN
jgi:hypothetical protein